MKKRIIFTLLAALICLQTQVSFAAEKKTVTINNTTNDSIFFFVDQGYNITYPKNLSPWSMIDGSDAPKISANKPRSFDATVSNYPATVQIIVHESIPGTDRIGLDTICVALVKLFNKDQGFFVGSDITPGTSEHHCIADGNTLVVE